MIQVLVNKLLPTLVSLQPNWNMKFLNNFEDLTEVKV